MRVNAENPDGSARVVLNVVVVVVVTNDFVRHVNIGIQEKSGPSSCIIIQNSSSSSVVTNVQEYPVILKGSYDSSYLVSRQDRGVVVVGNTLATTITTIVTRIATPGVQHPQR